MSTESVAHELPKQYDHAHAQNRWYPFWEERGYFHSEPDPSRTPYTIVIPPPNVTGALHLGHALNNTLQDILIRWKRMQGFNTLWMPGTDHAGIATQAVVERRLLRGRKARPATTWAARRWSSASGTGRTSTKPASSASSNRWAVSCDWQRTRFTLDDQCARAVRQTFFSCSRTG